ncbi:MAG: glycine hydroxymethyltransferase [Micromonosporaceae bacterium]|nr:glycine hydroxymethyltransferase [Micromonosporaceae bacterium]
MTERGLLRRYLATTDPGRVDAGAAAFFSSLDVIARVSPSVADTITRELRDQRANLKLIASENFSSLAVQLAQGNLFTDKYAEGFAGHRFYAGCDNVDAIEAEAADLGRTLFGADHVYVQPHSGADANLVAFLAILATTVEGPALEKLGQTNVSKVDDVDWEALRHEFTDQRLLGMDYYSGGHLTHGYRHNVSARLFQAHSYTVDPETKLLDLDAIRRQARELRPRILLAGYSAYPRAINFAEFRELADEIGATFMVDMAHFAGLVAGKVFTGDYDPVAHAHVVTTTTHKTLRGPRGGMVLCTPEYAPAVDKGCPMVLGGPLPHVMAAKAVALREALEPGFCDYAHAIVDNSRSLAEALQSRGAQVLTGGTDNHLVLVDVAASYGLTGRQAESALRSCGLTLNRNSLPFDANGPWYTSGLRLGTPAVTTLGMGTDEVVEIADIITSVLADVTPAGDSKAKYSLAEAVVDGARKRVADLLGRYPLYPEIDLDIVTG